MGLATIRPSIDTDTVRPEDYGLLAWNWEPQFALTTTAGLNTAGRLNVWTVPIRVSTRITNVHFRVLTAGTNLTTGSCGVALYTSAAAIIGSTVGATVTTAFNTVAYATIPLTSGPFTVAGNTFVQVAMWWNGTASPSAPFMFRGAGITDPNLALTAATGRFALADTGITTTPPSTLGTKTGTATIPIWVGLS